MKNFYTKREYFDFDLPKEKSKGATFKLIGHEIFLTVTEDEAVRMRAPENSGIFEEVTIN